MPSISLVLRKNELLCESNTGIYLLGIPSFRFPFVDSTSLYELSRRAIGKYTSPKAVTRTLPVYPTHFCSATYVYIVQFSSAEFFTPLQISSFPLDFTIVVFLSEIFCLLDFFVCDKIATKGKNILHSAENHAGQ